MEARNLLETGAGAPDPGYVQKVTKKWSGLCEGVQNPYEKGVLAILLEILRSILTIEDALVESELLLFR